MCRPFGGGGGWNWSWLLQYFNEFVDVVAGFFYVFNAAFVLPARHVFKGVAVQVADKGLAAQPCLHSVPRLDGFAGVVVAAYLGGVGGGGWLGWRGGGGFAHEVVVRVCFGLSFLLQCVLRISACACVAWCCRDLL